MHKIYLYIPRHIVKSIGYSLASILLFPGFSVAESSKNSNGFKVSGYLDGTYNYLTRSNQFTSGVTNRAYDLNPNGFTLNQAGLMLAKQPSQGFGGVLSVILGRDANTTAAYGWDPYAGSRTLAIDAVEAYLQYATGALTLIGGKFGTLAGYETWDPTKNTNISRALTATFAEPTTQLGIRGTYAVNEKLNVILGLNNGWDSIRDTRRRPTAEVGISYIFNPIWSLMVSAYSGEQRVEDRVSIGPKGRRDLFNLISTLKVTKKLTFVANYDYARQTRALLPDDTLSKAVWQGIIGYLNYQFDPKWRASLRGEIFNDRDGYRTGISQTLRGATLTVAYAWRKDFELRAEVRRDYSNTNAFLNKDGIGTSRSQQSFAVEAVYKF